MFEIKVEDLAGRVGRLQTRSGSIETPYLFPVVDPLLRKQVVSVREIRDIGFRGVITNAYLALKGYGSDVDIHKVLGFDGVVMTDSGAYQLMQYGDVDVGNKEIMMFQCSCGSDIGVPLDIPTRYEDSRERVVYSVIETLRRLREGADIVRNCSSTLWVAPIQGGVQLDMLYLSAKRIVDEGFLGLYSIAALGSPTTLLERFRFDRVLEMIGLVRRVLPASVPLHLFGAGHPLIIPFAVALGVDTMDSASYILYARDGRYMTSRGTYRIEELEYFPCSCPVCSKYSPRELLELEKPERVRLLALHNLYIIKQEISRVKQAIKEGRFWEYLEEVSKRHPAARRAFEVLLRFYNIVISRTPSARGETRSLMVLGDDSIYNPRALRARAKVSRMRMKAIDRKSLVLVPLLHKWKPLRASPLVRKLASSETMIVGYAPVIGAVPIELSDAFPFSQFETCNEFSGRATVTTALEIQEFLEKFCNDVKSIKIVFCSDIAWSKDIALELLKNLCRGSSMHKEIIELVCGSVYE